MSWTISLMSDSFKWSHCTTKPSQILRETNAAKKGLNIGECAKNLFHIRSTYKKATINGPIIVINKPFPSLELLIDLANSQV